MIRSLRNQGDESKVLVLALDEAVPEVVFRLELGNVEVISWEALHIHEPNLSSALESRTKVESFFTSTPVLVEYAMHNYPEMEFVVYLDSDLFFFDSPACVIDELEFKDVAIIPHGYAWPNKMRLAKYGTYNVGWVGFRNNSSGRRVAAWWKDRCLEWCSDEPSDGRYADQGYLDSFLSVEENTQIIRNLGMNLAPWNTAGRRITLSDSGIKVNGDKLVFFHFHGLSLNRNRWYTREHQYLGLASRALIKNIYRPYVSTLEKLEKDSPNFWTKDARSWRRVNSIKASLRNMALIVLGQTLRKGKIE
jgi:hypothetical protein